ncbi:uncharacterized protein LOC110726568 [Chenopodium quinoa]|uniref:uncharacterized protein LOC110726568 n=1 Tax=Chenopodium quinoa TaxID=63459 RepID=UPI000B78D191|nr:uncharacterized protein LOC110726568 [Chenopodium quinoa]
MPLEESDVESDAWPSDDSEDDDYEVSDVEADFDMELDIDDEYIVREEDVPDNIPEKTFEDYLDGSHVLDKMYKNGKIWSHLPFGSIELEEWYIARRLIRNCNWRIHALVLKDKVSWAIKKLEGEHATCGRLEENPMVSSAWLCRHLLQDLEANLDVPVDSLQRLCMERYRIHVKLRLLYKVKSLGREQLHGGFAEPYAALPKYAEMIKSTNPGSYALVTWTDSGDQSFKFKSCFISFSAQVKGFLGGCRPIIGIDRAHLSGYYKGMMLTAVSIDGNNEIFVLAYGIVDTESIDSWTYFFRNLRCLFAQYGSQKDDWTFISDRMRLCLRCSQEQPREYVYSNCKTAGWSGTTFHKLFWIAANAYNEYVFGKAMSKIKEYDAATFDYLTNVEEQWSVHMFDRTVCCDHNITNFVESFNAITKSNKDMPVLTLLEVLLSVTFFFGNNSAVRNWCMKRMGSKFDKAVDMEPNELTEHAKGVLETRIDESFFFGNNSAVRNWCMKRMGSKFDKAVDMEPNELTEHAKGVLETRTDESRFCHVTAAGGGEFEVRDGHVKFLVTLGNMTCGCGKWQGLGIPCKHGLRVIYNQRLEPRDFVSPFYKGAAYKLTYEDHIHPMADPTH